MTGRKALLKSDIRNALRNVPKGAPSFYTRRQAVMLSLINDLSEINQLYPRLSCLKKETIFSLLKLWRSRGAGTKTLHRKISILRTIVRQHCGDKIFPTNAELGIQYKLDKKRIVSKEMRLADIKDDLVRDICMLQYHFGLKKSEAIHFKNFSAGDVLLIPRSIAYNSKERHIPILTEKQRQVLTHFDTQHLNGFIADHLDVRLIALTHSSQLKLLDIRDGDYFRYEYIKNRYEALKTDNTLKQLERLRILRQELGYRENKQIKEILQCLNVS